MRSAATPTGRRSVSTVRCGIDAVVVRPYERRPSPATKKPISTAASVSPRASASDLPVSAATISLASSRRSRRSSAIARTTSPRSTAVRAAHSGCAARAAADRSVRVGRARARDAAEIARRPPGASSRAIPRPRPAAPRRRRGSAPRAGITRPTSRRRRRGSRPVTYDDASEARNTTAPTASETSISRPSGERAANASTNGRGLAVLDPVRRERVDPDAAPRPSRSRGSASG